MFAIRARRKTVTEKDFLDAVNKVPIGPPPPPTGPTTVPHTNLSHHPSCRTCCLMMRGAFLDAMLNSSSLLPALQHCVLSSVRSHGEGGKSDNLRYLALETRGGINQ